ncbi:MAG: MBL fold metallo-hydrolase [Gammaproteobacteria bacterium]|nr:MBL fold metallo-hydrolase [Gammaproteobacteria bacterium]
MSILRVIMLDVGWGDSILIESEDDQGNYYCAVVDSNDTNRNRFTLNFLKRRLQTFGIDYRNHRHFLDFVMLTHGHADHGQGLKAIMQEFGTSQFWYSKSSNWSSMGNLLSYARRSSKVDHHQAIDDGIQLPDLGEVQIDVLWPIDGNAPESDENNNSIVMTLTLNNVVFLLSGDAEKEVWDHVAPLIPANTLFFKVPHHGSVNGSFDGSNPAWLNNCPGHAELGISCHVGRFGHPDQAVIQLFENSSMSYLRTDHHYHLVYETDGQNIQRFYHH